MLNMLSQLFKRHQHDKGIKKYQERIVLTEPWSSETGWIIERRLVRICSTCEKIIKRYDWVKVEEYLYGGIKLQS